jgi:O-antigen ligase
MKWLYVAGTLTAFILIGSTARADRRVKEALGVALGLFPYFNITLNPISFENYRGDSRGLEFHLLDFVVVAMMVALPSRGAEAPTPLRLRFMFYVAAAALSMLQAPNPLFSMFAVWKVLRTFLVFVAVTRACRRGGLAPQLLWGLALGMVISGVLALKQRYLEGLLAAKGPFEHQNGLGLSVNLVVPFCYALVLTGSGGWIARAAIVFGGIAVVLTLSRGGLFMFVAALAMVYAGSLARRVTSRKLVVLAMSFLAAGVVLLKSLDTIIERFTTASDASAEARHVFEDAAKAMLHDHPMGIGMNQFSLVLDRSYADPLDIPEVDRDGIVHNIYWLTAAELGYLGILAYAILLASPLSAALRGALRDRSLRGDVLLGFTASFLVTYLQGTLEWALRMTQVGYLLWVVSGVAVSLAAMSLPGRSRA